MSVLTKKLTDALSDKLKTPSTSDCTTQLWDTHQGAWWAYTTQKLQAEEENVM